MVRHERLVMLATLAMLQVVTVVTGVYAMSNDLDLSALHQPTDTDRVSPKPIPPSPWSPRGRCWPAAGETETDLSRPRVL